MMKFKTAKSKQALENVIITTICGPMCAGKSAEIIAIAGKYEAIRQSYICFKPDIDNRIINGVATNDKIVSRRGSLIVKANVLNTNFAITPKLKNKIVANDIFIFDEVQFFQLDSIKSFIEVCCNLAVKHGHKKIFFAGLDRDFAGNDFPTIAYLKTISHRILELTTSCSVLNCDNRATLTAKIGGKDPKATIEIGGDEIYRAVCKKHYDEINAL